MLWVKALHIIFVISWMAGLLYLPRLFVNHAMVDDVATKQQLALMESKLLRFTTILAKLAVIFGVWYGFLLGWEFVGGGWMHAKLTLVLGLGAFHIYCAKLVRDFAAGRNTRSHVWFRWFNEIPTVLMIAIVILVVVKPF
nr:CopD family protein [Chitinimonas sp. BJYL2]